MPTERLIVSADRLAVQLRRLAHQLVERHGDFEHTVLLGLQNGGAPVARRLQALLAEGLATAPRLGLLDATFHRDDFRRRPLAGPPAAHATSLDFALENQRVVLVDDVLFTGRTVRAALDALLTYGRPAAVDLLVLVDRRHRRDLPIEATYVGLALDTRPNEDVRVRWAGEKEATEDGIFLIA
ncbi:MAG: bifunctional pyr operon transcriptional regulator/uracil phosphoribosyltransferase PyrR [Hymenobacteraceae bacterium]|nr:bifunctional pyr operon transcriptional regulator/uracil phosphoribosyltransferase PyrR [Hymenobacteraceae bacterium]